MKTQEQWTAERDVLARQFPIGSRVETTPAAFGFDETHRGVVTGHTARTVEWDDEDGTAWRMSPASLRAAP